MDGSTSTPTGLSYEMRLRRLGSLMEGQWSDAAKEISARRHAQLKLEHSHETIYNSAGALQVQRNVPAKLLSPSAPHDGVSKIFTQLGSSSRVPMLSASPVILSSMGPPLSGTLRGEGLEVSPSEVKLKEAMEALDRLGRAHQPHHPRQPPDSKQHADKLHRQSPHAISYRLKNETEKRELERQVEERVRSLTPSGIAFSLNRNNGINSQKGILQSSEDMAIRRISDTKTQYGKRGLYTLGINRYNSVSPPERLSTFASMNGSAKANSNQMSSSTGSSGSSILTSDQIYTVASAAARAAVENTPSTLGISQSQVVFRAAVAAAAAAASTAATAIALSPTNFKDEVMDVTHNLSGSVTMSGVTQRNSDTFSSSSSKERPQAHVIFTPGNSEDEIKEAAEFGSQAERHVERHDRVPASAGSADLSAKNISSAAKKLSPKVSMKSPHELSKDLPSANESSSEDNNVEKGNEKAYETEVARAAAEANTAAAEARNAAENAKLEAMNASSLQGLNEKMVVSRSSPVGRLSSRAETVKKHQPRLPHSQSVDSFGLSKRNHRSSIQKYARGSDAMCSSTGLVHARSPFFKSTGLLTYERNSFRIGDSPRTPKLVLGPSMSNLSRSLTIGSTGKLSPQGRQQLTSSVNGLSNIARGSNLASGSATRLFVNVESSLVPSLQKPAQSELPGMKNLKESQVPDSSEKPLNSLRSGLGWQHAEGRLATARHKTSPGSNGEGAPALDLAQLSSKKPGLKNRKPLKPPERSPIYGQYKQANSSNHGADKNSSPSSHDTPSSPTLEKNSDSELSHVASKLVLTSPDAHDVAHKELRSEIKQLQWENAHRVSYSPLPAKKNNDMLSSPTTVAVE